MEALMSSLLQSKNRLRLQELYLWFIVAGFVGWPFTRDYLILSRGPIDEGLAVAGGWLIAGVGVILLPIIFQLIFGRMPLEILRVKLSFGRANDGERDSNEILPEKPALDQHVLESLAVKSERIARSIYSRAGVYLIIGVAIAFMGLLFFYSQTANFFQDASGMKSFEEKLFSFLPRFGILFFIELLAFFFLRQYRSAMDEYRYYEAVQRNREELFALFVIYKNQGKELDMDGLLRRGLFFSKGVAVSSSQSSGIVDVAKLDKEEMQLLTKVIELIGKGR